VASGLGQVEDVLEDRRTALLVTPGSAAELAAAIAELARAPELGAELARGARAAAEGSHTWAHRASAVIEAVAGR
jgi:glycosyltransferase involved in cell wall biosynthesis